MAKHKHLNIKIRQGLVKTMAVGVAASTLFGGLALADTDGGGGSTGGHTGSGNYTSRVVWATNDNFGPANDGTVTSVLTGQLGGKLFGDASTHVHQATSAALTECSNNYAARNNGNAAGANCRVFAVGAVKSSDNTIASATGDLNQNAWMKAWAAEVNGKTYTHEGVGYQTNAKLSSGLTIDGMAQRETNGGEKSIVVIVLASDQPPLKTPPTPPTKEITKGVSADSMVNTTTITTGTGAGGKNMTISDTITPNGVTYRIKNQRIIDTTTGQDVSGQFTFNTTDNTPAPNNVATATWNGGQLPSKHDFQYILDIVVDLPATTNVDDFGHVTWDDKPTGNTDTHHFPTWTYKPNKAWLFWDAAAKKWAAVTDKDGSNAVGADKHVFLDGDKVATGVNTTVSADLAQAPENFTISDDYAKADYIFDPDMKDVHVYTVDTTDGQNATMNDIVSAGTDVTDKFTITSQGTVVTAAMKKDALAELKGLPSARQYTLLIGGKANYANGKGAKQVRKDAGVAAGSEVAFCENPATKEGLLNAGHVTVNNDKKDTNEPNICGYVPPVKKDVVGESSQGGDQDSINTKSVFPGQNVEYELMTTPQLSKDLAYDIETVTFTDTYDQWVDVDKQTIEVRDLTTGKTVSKKDYTMKNDAAKHQFTITLKPEYVKTHFTKGAALRYLVRFEATVKKDAPVKKTVNNDWTLKLNNSLTDSNTVTNIPDNPTPVKRDETKAGINIDGKTVYYGDDVYYRLTLDAASLKNQAYKVQRLGMVDDYDEEYLNVDESGIEVQDAQGRDVTDQFNIQVKDGMVYAFFKTVDTSYLDEVIKGNPQPTDLKEYSKKELSPKTDPSIDQNVLGQNYTIVLPMKVAKVTDGYVVKNTATQITNNREDITNTVTNPIKDINPRKDVTVKVNGESANGKSIYKNHQFLYSFDSSKITGNRAYKTITDWKIVDDYNEDYDKPTGQWAVYLNNDLTDKDGKVIAAKGTRIAGSGVDSTAFGADLFTYKDENGVITLEATARFLELASVMDSDFSWTGYIQMTRLKVSDRVENQFVETFNKVERKSNIVWTKTPDQTPAIKLIKYDAASGLEAGDRNTPHEALTNAKDGTKVVFRIINTGAVDLTRITLTDKTIAGSGEVTDLTYPDGWNNLVLKPGAYVEVTGTLKNMTGINHTNRGTTTGTPIVPCVVDNKHPFDPEDTTSGKGTTVPTGMCFDTPISDTDDWNATRMGVLAKTGAEIAPFILAAMAAAGLGTLLVFSRRRHAHIGSHATPAATTAEDEE